MTSALSSFGSSRSCYSTHFYHSFIHVQCKLLPLQAPGISTASKSNGCKWPCEAYGRIGDKPGGGIALASREIVSRVQVEISSSVPDELTWKYMFVIPLVLWPPHFAATCILLIKPSHCKCTSNIVPKRRIHTWPSKRRRSQDVLAARCETWCQKPASKQYKRRSKFLVNLIWSLLANGQVA